MQIDGGFRVVGTSQDIFKSVLLLCPESYRGLLENLHAMHPTWQFETFNTDINWNTFIGEDGIGSKNLINYPYFGSS